MPDVIDIDPALRALDALADDFADPGDETSACPSMWPLLAVPTDALSPLDRDARDHHLARCARCRVALADAWLDRDGAALTPAAAPLPAATALPALPDRRRPWTRLLAGAAVAAAAAMVAIVVPLSRHGDPPDLRAGASPIPPAAPLDLLILIERNPKLLGTEPRDDARVTGIPACDEYLLASESFDGCHRIDQAWRPERARTALDHARDRYASLATAGTRARDEATAECRAGTAGLIEDARREGCHPPPSGGHGAGLFAVRDAIDAVAHRVPADTRITIATATGEQVSVRARDVAAGALSSDTMGTAADFAYGHEPPRYAVVLGQLGALLPDRDRRRAVLVLATGCDAEDFADARRADALAHLAGDGVAIGAVLIRAEDFDGCPRAFKGGTALFRNANSTADLRPAAEAIVDRLLVTAPSPAAPGPRPIAVPSVPPAPPLELIVLVEDDARVPATVAAIDDALAHVRDRVPSDTRITVATAHGRDLSVLARDLPPTATVAVPPRTVPDGPAPAYEALLPSLAALFHDPAHRRAIVLVGDTCATHSYRAADPRVDALRAAGVAITSVGFRYPTCPPVVTPRYLSHQLVDLAATIGTAIDAAVRASGGPPPIEQRPPIDLLVLLDGHGAFLGDDPALAPTAYADVRDAIDGMDPHIPEHSAVRLGAVVGDTVTQLGSKEYPFIPLASYVIGESHAFAPNVTAPRYAIALERARHLLDARHERARALLIIATGCELVPDEREERERQLEALRADGVAVSMIEYRPAALAGCTPAFDPAPAVLTVRRATRSSALPGLVADAVEDFSRPQPPADLVHFLHDTLSAP